MGEASPAPGVFPEKHTLDLPVRHLVPLLGLLLFIPAAHAQVVWRGDFETGDRSQWTRTQMMSADRLEVVTSPVFAGRHALKATVRQGDDPINSSGNRNELVRLTWEPSGSEYYYRWQTMFSPDFPSAKTWQLFAQWHQASDTGGSPPVEFYVYGEELRLNIGGNPGTIVWRAPLERGRWFDFVFHVRWSADAKLGFVELYVDGKLVLPKRYIATQYPGQLNYLKAGLYRSDTITQTGVVYHDGWVQARQLQDVMPEAEEPDAGPTAPKPEPGFDAGVADAGGVGGQELPPDAGPCVCECPAVDAGAPAPGAESPPAGCAAAPLAMLGVLLPGLLRAMRRRG